MNRKQKGVVMKIAERGLQMVGFGFMRGTGANETSSSDIQALEQVLNQKMIVNVKKRVLAWYCVCHGGL